MKKISLILVVTLLLVGYGTVIAQSNYMSNQERDERYTTCLRKVYENLVGKTFTAGPPKKSWYVSVFYNSTRTERSEGFQVIKPEEFTIIRLIPVSSFTLRDLYEIKFSSGKVAFVRITEIHEISTAPEIYHKATDTCKY
jgi:hypothetical protein